MITLKWIGGEHPFALDIGALRALQQTCDAGPEQILTRIGDGLWRVDDLYETIRLGLMGGGMEGKGARELMNALIQRHPLYEFKATARLVLLSALVGDPDDPLGGATGETAPPENGGSA